MEVYLSVDPTTFYCSTVNGIAINLPGYDEPQNVCVNIWENNINWIRVNDKYIDAPFKFNIAEVSQQEIFELVATHKSVCHS
jgi:hypothetical protein